MTYEESLAYIHSFDWRGSRPGLSRIKELCAKLGDPQKGLRFVHVAGTNGKGSFCRMLSGILTSAGYKTGLFTSPFVTRFNERIMFCDEEIADADLARIVEIVKNAADTMADQPTEFELITAVGFVYFKEKHCDLIVLECGMGGRLDSTNIIESPVLSVITGVALDHTAILGDTVEKIAAEKAGIIKEGRPVLWGGDDEAATAVISAAAKEMGAPLTRVDYDTLQVKTLTARETIIDVGERKNLSLALLGSYQPVNAARVLAAVDLLKQEGWKIPEEAVREGLATAVWHARFERLSKDPLIFYDGGHNPEGVTAAAESIRACFGGRKVLLLMGVMADKDYSEMSRTLAPLAEKVFTVKPQNPRALAAERLAAAFPIAEAFPSVTEGVAAAVKEAKERGLPLVCLGSLYLYPEVVSALSAIL